MTVLSIEEFKTQSKPGSYAPEKTYSGKTILPGPIFSLTNCKAATLYCQRFTRKSGGALCLVVRDKSFLRIWSESILSSDSSDTSTSGNIASDKFSAESTNENEDDLDPSVSPEFIEMCQQALADYIGPVASIFCKKALAKKDNMTQREFVKILAKKLSDPQHSAEFIKKTLNT